MLKENELIIKAIRFGMLSAMEIHKAGGNPVHFINSIDDKILISMVRNNLRIVKVI